MSNHDYTVLIRRRAEKQIVRLPPKIQRQINGKILDLEVDPRPQDIKRLLGRASTFRVDSGEYRIVYEINDGEKIVTVLIVQHRKDVYKNF